MITTANILKDVTLILHFVGLASLLGGFLVQIKSIKAGTAKIITAMVHGAWTMLVTGLLLVGIRQWLMAIDPAAHEIDNLKIAVKSLVVAAIVVLVMINRKKETIKGKDLGSIGALTLLNTVIAVVW